ncbi:hypothetical protein [Saccharibacillus kuerlensis]|uniref:Uncharacterized protein n=1 Tax=Saccharibacillus kuerlensis TaxID=459527 RepID=A0ABQ2L4X5_9BACL|nr:hypothetical protein [Saccharibacillus kuerlensis]GGO03655.1 hypothetical protein GCM10010969_28020 [Saccharibacillus kuerlensis]
MKSRNVLWTMLIVLCIAGAAYSIYWPKAVQLEAQGVKFRLGEGSGGEEHLVQVKLQGDVWRSWRGTREFVGTIEIEGETFEGKERLPKVRARFDGPSGRGFITYDYRDDTGPNLTTYGVMYVDPSFRQVAIGIFEETEGGGQGWSSGSGLMVTAPAENRQQGLDIANRLMRDGMEGEELE